MGIDHVVDLGCAPKSALGGATELVALVKARSRAQAIVSLARKNGDMRPEAEIDFRIALRTPKGTEQRSVTVGQLFAQAAPLDAQANGCRGCAAAAGRAFGCYASIAYPIAARAESWLLARLPKDPRSTAGQLLRHATSDLGWDGSYGEKMRRQGTTFLEARSPEARRWDDGFVLHADQVHQMLFGVGHPSPSHAMMLSLFYGVIPHDVPPAVLRDPKQLAALLDPQRVAPEPDDAIEALAAYLRALAVAARLGVAVLVDG